MEFSFKNAEELAKCCGRKNCINDCEYVEICEYPNRTGPSFNFNDPRVFEGLRKHFRKKKLEKLLT